MTAMSTPRAPIRQRGIRVPATPGTLEMDFRVRTLTSVATAATTATATHNAQTRPDRLNASVTLVSLEMGNRARMWTSVPTQTRVQTMLHVRTLSGISLVSVMPALRATE